jgi:hypothetical protein
MQHEKQSFSSPEASPLQFGPGAQLVAEFLDKENLPHTAQSYLNLICVDPENPSAAELMELPEQWRKKL